MKERHLRLLVAVLMTGVTIVFLTILHFTLDPSGLVSRVFTARETDPKYPFSIQHFEWLAFFIACGELWVRYYCTGRQQTLLYRKYLPEDESTMLRAKDLGPIYSGLRSAPPDAYLPRLIRRLILQYRTTKNSGETQTLLNSSMDMFMHEVDLGYSMLRYMMWLIPSLGFLGTVQGVGDALADVGRRSVESTEAANLLPTATKYLAVAFDTTQVALLMASLLLLIMNLVQSREERMINLTGQYCMDNLINRLCEPQPQK